ncbi:MAG: hypothetical protein QG593_693, partial [Patescibacteria group bacterium]|nr:hypothetical protein [Patescibacteria group bacterium]
MNNDIVKKIITDNKY